MVVRSKEVLRISFSRPWVERSKWTGLDFLEELAVVDSFLLHGSCEKFHKDHRYVSGLWR